MKTTEPQPNGSRGAKTLFSKLFVTLDRLDRIDSVPEGVYGIELRVDLFPTLDFGKLEDALRSSPFPILVTVRRGSHGGEFTGTEFARVALMRRILLLKPAFIDLEYDTDPDFIEEVLSSSDTKCIISYHNEEKTPEDLGSIYALMSSYKACAYKMATFAASASDALRLFLFCRDQPRVSAVPIGEKGSFARVLSLCLKDRIGYGYLGSEQPRAEGQLPVEELIGIYRYGEVGGAVDFYGLIGDPVSQSIGHRYHNARFKEQNRNAIYVKIPLSAKELDTFLPLAKQAGFQGLSVTMPLKQAIVPYVDRIDDDAAAVGALNTLIRTEEGMFGTNFDGKGALDAVEASVSVAGKTVLLLGAGGAAAAIGFEAKKRGAEVTVMNRNPKRGEELAKRLGVRFLPSWEGEHYDLVVNATSESSAVPLEILKPTTVLLQVLYQGQGSLFADKARSIGVTVIEGEEMFEKQAEAQNRLWTSPECFRRGLH